PASLDEFMREPAVLTTLLGHKKKPRRGSTSSQRTLDSVQERDPHKKDLPKAKDSSDTTNLVTLVVTEEHQAQHLKAVLRLTGERLDYEMRRADQAEQRARTAESHARDVSTHVATAENERYQAKLGATRSQEEVKQYQLLAEKAERELRRVEAELQRSERLRKEAEQSAADARDVARKAQQALREHQAGEEGRGEGRTLEVKVSRECDDGRVDGLEDGRAQGFEAGYAEGFEAGRAEGYAAGREDGCDAGRLIGFEDGKKVGFSEGYEDGMQDGRRNERERSLKAFDKFTDSKEGREQATKQAGDAKPLPVPGRARSPRKDKTPPPRSTPSPERAVVPPPPPAKTPSPPPIPVWLHRKPNFAQSAG
ncbi:uncharacterized protein LAESUDRAFT_604021, partial [Laetiporus sulphureus 93-53]